MLILEYTGKCIYGVAVDFGVLDHFHLTLAHWSIISIWDAVKLSMGVD